MDNLSRRLKILLGILSIWPLTYMGLFMLGMLLTALFAPVLFPPGHAGHPSSDTAILVVFFVIMALHVLTAFLTMGLMVFYLVHVVKTERLNQDQRVLWAVLVFAGGVVAQPIYWYLHIWREPIPRAETTDAPGALWRKARVPMGVAMLYAAVWFAICAACVNSGLWPPHGPDEFRTVIPLFMVAFVFHGLAVMCVIGVTALCLAHAVGNKRLSNNGKIAWALVLFFLHMLAMPVYWYLYIWREPKSPDEPTQTNV